jgi:hypothetical protein
MRIRRMLKMLFSPRSERHEEVTALVAVSVASTTESANRLTQTIREMLEENDRVTGRNQNAHKPHS